MWLLEVLRVAAAVVAATALGLDSDSELASGLGAEDVSVQFKMAEKEVVSDDLHSMMERKPCIYDGCQDIGGICMKNKKKCDGNVVPNGCRGKKCKCCLLVLCEEPWVRIGDYCYYISYFTNETLTWEDARDFCQSFPIPNTDLARFDIKCEDYRDLFTFLSDSNVVPNTYFHIGADDNETEGTWRWVDGELVDMYAPYWGYGEPVPNDPTYNHACLYAEDGGNGYQRWKMGDCSGTEGYFICQSLGGVFIAG